MKAKLLGTATINGKTVSFFSPPHGEADFLWVDVEELALSFLPPADARRMVSHAQNFDRANRAAETAVNGDKIVTIISHPMAQGLCSLIDQMSGHPLPKDDEWGGGPANLAYVVALADTQSKFRPLGISGLIAAFKNQGGPSMRG